MGQNSEDENRAARNCMSGWTDRMEEPYASMVGMDMCGGGEGQVGEA